MADVASHNGKGVLLQPVSVALKARTMAHRPSTLTLLDIAPHRLAHTSTFTPRLTGRLGLDATGSLAGTLNNKAHWSPLLESLKGSLRPGSHPSPNKALSLLLKDGGVNSAPGSPGLSPLRGALVSAHGARDGRGDDSSSTHSSLRVVDMRALLAGPPKAEDAGLDERLAATEAVSLLVEVVRRRCVSHYGILQSVLASCRRV